MQGLEDEQVQKQGRQAMNGEIDQVVAPGVQAVEEVVQAKAEIGKRPTDVAFKTVKGCLDGLPVQRRQVHMRVVGNVLVVIEHPCPVETVGIDDGQNNE